MVEITPQAYIQVVGNLPEGDKTIGKVGIAEELPEGTKTIGKINANRPRVVYRTTGAVAISLVTTLETDFPGQYKRLISLETTWSTAPTTSESLTLTLTAANPNDPDVVLYSVDPATASLTSLVKTWEDGYPIMPNDELTLAFTNTDTRTVRVKLILEVEAE